MWFSEEVVSRVSRVSEPLPMDLWSRLRGDLFKQGRLDYVYTGRKVVLLQLVVIRDKYLFIYIFMLFYYVYVSWRLNCILVMYMYYVPGIVCRMD